MNAAEAFAQLEAQLLAQLEDAQDLDQAVSSCTMALEQIACVLAQDEQDEHARQRQQAVLACVRRAPQLLRAVCARGEIVLGSDENASQSNRSNPHSLLRRGAKAAGLFLLGALSVYELIDGQALFALLQLAGVLLLLGSDGQSDVIPAHTTARGVSYPDAQQLVRTLRELCQAVDICTSDLLLLEKDAGHTRLSGTADDAMLDLLTALMEAKSSGRNDLAMRSLNQAEQYLHLLGIELIGYDPAQAQLFDILPTMGDSRTIRPAMLKDGKLLRRGVAALNAERSVSA